MLPAASKTDNTKLPAKVIPLSAREENPKTAPITHSNKEKKAPISAKKEIPQANPENPFADWIMPPQPSGYENGSDYDFF